MIGAVKKHTGPSLWTRDFTIITLGSVISMFGNAMAGFRRVRTPLCTSGHSARCGYRRTDYHIETIRDARIYGIAPHKTPLARRQVSVV